MRTDPGRSTIWTPKFASLCAFVFITFTHQGVLLVTMPLYVTALGYLESFAGVLLGVFSVVSTVVRPLIGRLADRRALRFVLLAGLGVSAIGTLLHIHPDRNSLLVASVLLGISWGATNTGAVTTLAQDAPPDRRGRSAGALSVFQSTAWMIAPAVGLWVLSFSGSRFTIVFVVCTGLLFLALPLAVASTKGAPRPTSSDRPPVPGRVPRKALVPALLIAVLLMTQPAMMTFVPLYAASLGVSGSTIAWYFVLMAGLGVPARLVMASVSDRFGRSRTTFLGLLVSAAGIGLMAAASGGHLIVAAGLIYVFGHALAVPATTSMAMDISSPETAGRVMGIFSAAFQLGFGVGALVTARIATTHGYEGGYVALGVLLLVAAIALFRYNRLVDRASGQTTSATYVAPLQEVEE